MLTTELDSTEMPTNYTTITKEIPITSTTTPLSDEQNLYTNDTLGISFKSPSHIYIIDEDAELRKDGPVFGDRPEYKHYQIVINDKNKSSISIVVTAEETQNSSLDDWLQKDPTSARYFQENLVKFERKEMFDTEVMFGKYNYYDTDFSSHLFLIKNGFLYHITLNNLSKEEENQFWESVKFESPN